jgi:hypothetical protein
VYDGSVCYVYRDNCLEECGVELYFAQDMEILGKVSTHQLKDDGENELVTSENKEEYIRSAISVTTLTPVCMPVNPCDARHWHSTD